jgi:protein ImuB
MTRIVSVPSYDDLTPPIPDVVSAESVTQLALFLNHGLHGSHGSVGSHGSPESGRGRPTDPVIVARVTLYACMHSDDDSTALWPIARDFSPRVMRASDREILLDVSGLGRLIGEPAAIAAEIDRAVGAAGLRARVAIAPTQTAARLLAGVPAGAANVVVSETASALAPLPVARLQPLEVLSPRIHLRDRVRPYEIFESWGIATLGDLVALPAADVSARLGRRGVALQRLARGLDARPFVPDGETPRYRERLELEWPIDGLEPLSFVLARLLDPLSTALERADRGAAAVHLDLRLTDRSTHARVLQLPAPMRDPRILRTLLLLDLESHPPFGASESRREPTRSGGSSAQRGGESRGAPPSEVMIDIVAIEIDPAPARITQFSLLERALPSAETLSTLMARLSALVGESRVGAPALVDTHRPGAFEMRRFQPESSARDVTDPHPGDLKAGPADVVMRRQRVPPALRVNVERGRPVFLSASRRGMPSGTVTQAAGPWRTSGGWHGESWNRDEWDVALASGAICRIFQDRSTGRWFLDGVYD